MPRRATSGLNQTRLAAKKSFLVRVENRYERNLRQIESLAQKIDSHEHIELAFAQRAQNLYALNRINVAVEILHAHADVAQVICEFLSRALGERGDQHALLEIAALSGFLHQIINLTFERLDCDFGINQARWSHHEFSHAGLEFKL